MVIFKGIIHCAIGLSVLYILKVDGYLIYIGAGIGSYLPDSDIKNSPAAFWLPMYKFFKHRKETHSLYFGMCFSSVAYIINPNLGIGLLIGYILHIMADSLTPMQRTQPMPVFFPFTKR